MKKNWVRIIMLAILLCIVLVVGYQIVCTTTEQGLSSTKTKPVVSVSILHAARDVQRGSVITADDILEVQLEQSRIPQGALSNADLKDIIGKTVRYGISKGQIISSSDIVSPPWKKTIDQE